jgi:phosphoribosylformylglycinamidine synthase
MDAFERVLHLPAVADKTFLVTITDRSVTGRVARDQMVGPYQLPAADCAVTTTGYATYEGQAMATGERSPVALLDGPASGRMAIAEAITNIAAADVGDIGAIRLSANWMAPCGDPGEDAILYDTVYNHITSGNYGKAAPHIAMNMNVTIVINVTDGIVHIRRDIIDIRYEDFFIH